VREEGAPGRGDDTLAHALDMLRRRSLIIVATVIACVGIALAQRALAGDVYETSAEVMFGAPSLSDAALEVNRGGVDPEREAATNVQIAESQEVADAVRQEVGGPSAQALLDQVAVEAEESADVLRITASDEAPVRAAALANSFAEQYIRFKAQRDLDSIAAAEADLRRQLQELPPRASERRASLADSLERLASLRAVASGDARLLGRADPPADPAGIGGAPLIVLAVIVGLALGLVAAFLAEAIDRRINTVEDFEHEYRMSALVGIPEPAFRVEKAELRSDLLEPYRILRSTLKFARVSHQLDVIVVTSAVPAEGKTTIAVDLAHAIALTSASVVLVELDLRRPTLSRHLDLDPRRGVTSALLGQEPASELLQTPFEALPNFAVMPAGRLPPNPSELLGTEAAADLLAGLAADGAIVIVDAPPLLPVSDTHVLFNLSVVGGVLIGARLGLTTRDEARRARAIIDRHPVKPLGLVVTGVEAGGRYGYEAYASEDPSPPIATPAGTAPPNA
jgi:capsular exopolysaccharide synthesis family protein